MSKLVLSYLRVYHSGVGGGIFPGGGGSVNNLTGVDRAFVYSKDFSDATLYIYFFSEESGKRSAVYQHHMVSVLKKVSPEY